MTAQQKTQVATVGGVIAISVGIVTLIGIVASPLWGLEQRIESHETRIQRLDDSMQRMEKTLDKIDGKVDRLIERGKGK